MDFESFTINYNKTISDALTKIDKNGKRIVIVSDDKNKVYGVLSDGDIRRFLLKNGKKTDLIKKVCRTNYKFSHDIPSAKALLNEFSCVPILDNNKTLRMLLFSDNTRIVRKTNLPIVIQAGGLGTRLYPYTKILPKPLIPVGDKPIIENIIDQFVEFGCNEFYVIVNYKKEMIKAYFAETKKDYNITFIDENEPLGTGGGLSLLKGIIKKTFILTNCDIMISGDFTEMVDYHKHQQNNITMVTCNIKVQIPYGVVNINEQKKITSFQEKPTLEYLINTGLYVVEPIIIEQLEEKKKIGFPDICKEYKDKDNSLGVYIISEKEWLDMGELDKLNQLVER